MRVVSLVPSWTETLVRTGVDVVGRSRFCIHPKDKVRGIPIVGGTKDWDLAKLKALQPDLLLLDKEENPKFMAEQREIPYFATHVESIASMPGELAKLADLLKEPALGALARRWDMIAEWRGLSLWTPGTPLPGVLEWGREAQRPVGNLMYIIWRDPWMAVAKNTFIGSVLEKCGLGAYMGDFAAKYPKIDLPVENPEGTLLLFSSEPYPFLRKKAELTSVPSPYAFVDGECFSWFGVRSLEFLEGLKTR